MGFLFFHSKIIIIVVELDFGSKMLAVKEALRQTAMHASTTYTQTMYTGIHSYPDHVHFKHFLADPQGQVYRKQCWPALYAEFNWGWGGLSKSCLGPLKVPARD